MMSQIMKLSQYNKQIYFSLLSEVSKLEQLQMLKYVNLLKNGYTDRKCNGMQMNICFLLYLA